MKYNAVLFDYGKTLSGGHAWIDQMIRQLYESGYRLGIVSNSNRYGDAHWLRAHAVKKWSGCFEVVIGSGGFLGNYGSGDQEGGWLGCHKPDMLIYERAIDFLRVSADRIIFVGDNIKADVLGPLEIGMTGMLICDDLDYAPQLWNLLKDKPCKRPNLITSYQVEDTHGSGFFITTRLNHLTEPLQIGEQIIAGIQSFEVLSWDLKHDKKDILNTTANHDKYVRIGVMLA